jgi:hypothetical protein
MAIGRVPGPALLSNLDRQGLDLQFTTNSNSLVYMDFANFKLGVNTAAPTDTLTVNGDVGVAGNITPSLDNQFTIGEPGNRFKNIYVGNLAVGGIELSGNISADNVFANLIYEDGNRVLTVQSNIIVSGDVTGFGSNSNVAVTLVDTGVVAGTYGAGDDEYADLIPKITVDSKGRITAISNVALTQIGNISFNDTTISSTSNISITTVDQQIFVGASRISNAADPEDPQDVVTLAYLDAQLDLDKRSISANNTSVSIVDNNISAGVIEFVADGANIANVSVETTEFKSNVVTFGNLSVHGQTLYTSGNIILDAQGAGVVQFAGGDAIGLPVGDNSGRPSSPQIGYIRYNTDIDSVEYWNGTAWYSPDINTMASQIITPNGVDDTYTLDEAASNETAIVIINGTVQQTQVAYQISGYSITFSEVPSVTDIIEVRTMNVGAVSVQSLSYGNTSVTLSYGNVNTTGDIIPTATETYNIGSNDLRWKEIYLSGNSIYLGNTQITTDGVSLQFLAEGSETPINLGEGSGSGDRGYTGSQGAIGYTGSSGSGSGASVTTSIVPPSTPSDGDLWWNEEEGQLKIYYDDGNSSQWVDASASAIGYTGSLGYTGSQGLIGYTGSSGSGINPASRWEEYYELVTFNLAEFAQYATGTGATVNYNAASVGHPGVIEFITGSTSTGQAGILKTSAPQTTGLGNMVFGGGEIVYEALVEIPVLWNTGVEEGFIRAGFMDEIAGAPTNGAHMQYQSTDTRPYLFTRSAGSSTIVLGTTPLTTGWHHIKIVVNSTATSVSMYVDGVLEATSTTNIPTAGVSYGANIQKGTGTTSYTYRVDMFRVYQTFSTPRY